MAVAIQQGELPQNVPNSYPRFGLQAATPTAVYGVMFGGVFWAYDAPEYRAPYDGEVYQRDGVYYVAIDMGQRFTGRDVTAEVMEGVDAGRYWPGTEWAEEQEYSSTVESFLMGAR